VLAHVRGAYHAQVSIGDHNLHPFRYPGCPWALAHNGDLYRFPELKFALVEHLKPAIAQRIRGTTDSEWMYALLLSQLDSPERATAEEVARAVVKMLGVLRKCREAVGIEISSPTNLFLCNGQSLVAARFTFDYGCYPVESPEKVHEMQLRYLSLWYTAGASYGFSDGEWKMRGGFAGAKSVMVASEPLTRDLSTWVEVPAYGMIYVEPRETSARISSLDIDI
jgi:glutamine amidotransferase